LPAADVLDIVHKINKKYKNIVTFVIHYLCKIDDYEKDIFFIERYFVDFRIVQFLRKGGI
jgi:ABC-type multidrug transport system ATPase subunit